jgi:hypothetical protein
MALVRHTRLLEWLAVGLAIAITLAPLAPYGV